MIIGDSADPGRSLQITTITVIDRVPQCRVWESGTISYRRRCITVISSIAGPTNWRPGEVEAVTTSGSRPTSLTGGTATDRTILTKLPRQLCTQQRCILAISQGNGAAPVACVATTLSGPNEYKRGYKVNVAPSCLRHTRDRMSLPLPNVPESRRHIHKDPSCLLNFKKMGLPVIDLPLRNHQPSIAQSVVTAQRR